MSSRTDTDVGNTELNPTQGSNGRLRSVRDRLRQPKGRLASLVKQTDQVAHINKIFKAYLPPHMHDYVRLAALSTESWVVQADSASWATRLRYALPTLRQQISDHLGRDIPPLNIRIEPLAKPKAEPVRRLQLTENNAAVIEGAAQSVTDERLGAALMRLASHAR